MNKHDTPPPPPGRRRSPRSRREEERNARRQAGRRFIIALALVAFVPALFPSLPVNKGPEPAATPRQAHSAEQPPYDNEPAEPAEGTSLLRLSAGR